GLVKAPAVPVGGVKKVHAPVDGVMDDADRFVVVALAVGAAERHAAQPDRRDGKIAVAQGTVLRLRAGGHGDPLLFQSSSGREWVMIGRRTRKSIPGGTIDAYPTSGFRWDAGD